MEDTAKSSSDEIRPVEGGEGAEAPPPPAPKESDGGGGGGWGGWGFSPLSYLSDLQKAATVAAEEISRNAVEAAKTAAKSIGDMQNVAEDSESSKEDDIGESTVEVESEDEHDKRRKAALEKLEKASDESLLGQGLKVIDSSVEKFASGAWQAFGNAWKGGSTFVNRLENGGLPGSPGSVAPSLIEKGKAFTARGIEVLELVGKETMDLLIAETGMEIDKDGEEGQTGEDPSFEEVTFDRCFYIYGGPEQLEELEALANHHTLLFNRRKAKLSSEQKSIYDGKLKQVQQIFNLTSKFDENGVESEKGKEVENGTGGSVDEMKYLHDSSVSKAAELAAGFANALAGLAPNDMIQRTVGRLDSLHSEGVHRLSEMCCFAVSQLLVLGKSIMSKTNKAEDKDVDEDSMNIDWPEDCVERAKIIRSKALLMTGNVEAVSNSFITGISEVAEAFAAAIKASTADSEDAVSLESIHEKAKTFSGNLETDNSTAIGKIQDGLLYLTYLLLSTSVPTTP